jgi:CRISPR system Cascade subunit CasB
MSDDKPARFFRHLRELRDDRAAMAALRRSLAFDASELGEVRAYRFVEPFVASEDGWRREAYYLAAGLYAMHPEEAAVSLPEALSRLCHEDGQRSIERHFQALLQADRDELPDRLRRLVAMLRAKGKGIDYEKLLRDLLRWNAPDRWVQRRWARIFYSTPTPTTEAEEAEAVSSGEVLA